ncbi:glycosyltransferase [Haloarcula hispanica]|uniref:Glycosyltransferase n=1 Tax=Haloarcula hispanica TaxID=51589 RepID=A0A5J5LLT1_HALHI|nr:glycosyltransferase family 4 protein [Haloarcula hispanica]KAA9410373.1 glycosyltransferase [Haloarcula hispanica]
MASREFKIFYPHYIDIDEPISKIHKEIATQLGPKFSVTAFASDQNIPRQSGIDKLISVSTDSNIVAKTTQYARAYFQPWDLVHTGPSRRHHLGLLSHLRGSTLVHTLHSTPKNKRVIERQRRLSHKADYVTAVSPYVESWAREILGIQENLRTIPNGIKLADYEQLDQEDRDGHILYVGRLIQRKHPELIIRIAKIMPEREFKVCGSGPLESTLREDAPENVEVLGYASRDKVRSLYSNALTTLCPYEREGFGLVVVESFASGTPVIGYKSGNLPHLLTDKSGIICETLTPENWRSAITAVSDNIKQFSPYERAEKYKWETIGKLYRRFYCTILK